MSQRELFTILFAVILVCAILNTAEVLAFTYKASEPLPGMSGPVTDVGSYLNNIFNFLLGAAAVLAVLKIVMGGMKYIGAAGNPSTITDAREDIQMAVFGLILALSSYLILFTINPNLLKLDFTVTATPSTPSPTPTPHPPTPNPNPDPQYTAAEARKKLTDRGIFINKGECSAGQTENCTSLDGARKSVVDGAINLKQRCPSCNVRITGGTEPGHASGDQSHAKGYKLDFAAETVTNNFIANNFERVGVRPGAHGGIIYKDPATGARYVREHDHWDAYGWEVDGTR